jgi:Domain of unknown function (DUF3560)
MTTITITHTPAEGTLTDELVRGDGSYEILLAKGFKWFRSLGVMGLPHSRDRAPHLRQIEAAIAALEDAGFEVTAELDVDPRPAGQADADKRERLSYRAERLAEKAEKLTATGEALLKSAHDELDQVPFGQPILVGHHSEGRHRRMLERTWNKTGKGYALQREGEQIAVRAEVAAYNAETAPNPRALARKVQTLTADINRWQRELDGKVAARNAYYGDSIKPATGTYRDELILRIAYATEEITHASAQIQAAKDAGVVLYDKDSFDKAEVKAGRVRVKCWAGEADGYAKVTRVNAKTVSIERHGYGGGTWSETIPYDRVFGIKVTTAAQQIEEGTS